MNFYVKMLLEAPDTDVPESIKDVIRGHWDLSNPNLEDIQTLKIIPEFWTRDEFFYSILDLLEKDICNGVRKTEITIRSPNFQ